jgi:uncharacterized phage protein (TIGR01671 family)
MREIKFRFWLKKHNYFVRPEGYGYMSFGVHLDGKIVQFGLEKSYTPFSENGDEIVAQQFIGLKDKNGIEIYEGDVLYGELDLRNEYSGDLFTFKGPVIYKAPSFVCDNADFALDSYELEVVGNVFENPLN